VAVSPDGTMIAFSARVGGGIRLSIRRIDDLEATDVAGSDGANGPFFSPDGRWLGFFAGGKLKKVSLSGGMPIDIADVPGAALGASWGANDTIVYSEGDRGLMRIPASGGSPELVRRFDPNLWVATPDVIPGSSALLVTVRTLRGPHVGVVHLPSGELELFDALGEAAGAHYSSAGYLLFGQGGALRAAPFDVGSLRVTGPSVMLRDSVALSDGHPLYAVSDGGTLVYVPPIAGNRRLVWVDRAGHATNISDRTASYFRPRLSPDGRRVLVNLTTEQAGSDLWLFDLERGSLQRLLPEASSGIMSDATWTPDGTRVTCYRFVTDGDSTSVGIAEVPADGGGDPVMLLPRDAYFPHSWSPDDRVLALYAISPDPAMQRDIWTFDRSGELRSLFATRANERSPAFSPDGRWLAYVSDESGQDEVYVVAYPSLTGKTQISLDGGRVPEWRRDGRELFYRNGLEVVAVTVHPGATWRHDEPRILFEGEYWSEPVVTGSHDYDVSLDGQRFLMISTPRQTYINVVLNWMREIGG